MVANFQTFGTVVVGVLTSAATWFMFGKNLLAPTDFDDMPEYPTHHAPANMVTYQLHRSGGVPETMYPRQTDLYYLRQLPKEGEALVLISAAWLPSHGKELDRMRVGIEAMWQRGLGHVKLAYLPFESLLRRTNQSNLMM